jgi:hypothetical protein
MDGDGVTTREQLELLDLDSSSGAVLSQGKPGAAATEAAAGVGTAVARDGAGSPAGVGSPKLQAIQIEGAEDHRVQRLQLVWNNVSHIVDVRPSACLPPSMSVSHTRRARARVRVRGRSRSRATGARG